MSWQPCLRCEQRFPGEALNVYLSVFAGEEREAYRFVVCPECFELLVAEWRQRALYRNDQGDWTYHDPDEAAGPRYSQAQPPERPGRRSPGPAGDLPWDQAPRGRQRRKSL